MGNTGFLYRIWLLVQYDKIQVTRHISDLSLTNLMHLLLPIIDLLRGSDPPIELTFLLHK